MSTPDTTDGIIVDYDHFCDDHLEQLEEFDIDFFSIVKPVLNILLVDDVFFETTYRLRNGYGIPEGTDKDDIPPGERPGVEHMNEAFEEFAPLCCYIAENREESKTELPQFIEALAEVAGEKEGGNIHE